MATSLEERKKKQQKKTKIRGSDSQQHEIT